MWVKLPMWRPSILQRHTLLAVAIFALIFTLFSVFGNFLSTSQAIQIHQTRLYQQSNDEPFTDTWQIQLERLKRIHEICKTNLTLNRDSKSTQNSAVKTVEHLIIDDKSKLIYCYVPKVASTNWKRTLIALRKPQTMNPLDIDSLRSHREFRTQLKDGLHDGRLKDTNYIRFLFVRHPLERLLSTYRNKFELAYTDYFRKRFGRVIRSRYEKNLNENDPRNDGVVSFTQFLRFVADKIEWNEHWQSTFDICHPCDIKYNYIGKYETLQEDANILLEKIAKLNNLTIPWSFPTREMTYYREPTSKLMDKYYSQIPSFLKEKLIGLFNTDFQLFSYGN